MPSKFSAYTKAWDVGNKLPPSALTSTRVVTRVETIQPEDMDFTFHCPMREDRTGLQTGQTVFVDVLLV